MDPAAWQFAGSVAAIAALVLLASKLGFSGRPRLRDEDEARALASEISGGFDAVEVALDRSRCGALLRDADGRAVLVAPAGAHFVARLLGPNTAITVARGTLGIRDGATIATLDLGSGTDNWAKVLTALG